MYCSLKNLCLHNLSSLLNFDFSSDKQSYNYNTHVLIFIANFIKGKFGIKTEETKDILVKEEPVKIIELKNTVIKEEKKDKKKKKE